jgi:PAS domain S-box-containing protein
MLRSGVVKGETEEVAFAASEPLFRVAFENAPIGMVVASPDLSTVRVNHALCEMLGYSESDLLALGLWAVTHPEDIEPNLASMQRALAGEIDSYALEKRYIHRNGQVVWGRLNGSLVRDASGAPLYFVSQIEDVTERKAVHDALAASEIRFRTAFENAPIGMALIASNQRTLQVNRALCAMLGYTQAELLDLTLRDLTHPDDVAANLALVERAMAGEMESFWLEKRYIRKDGSILWAWLTASFVRDESGVPLYFISQIQDISERKVADDALAVSEERFRVAFEDAPIGVAIVRPDLAILRVNRASCEILGYPEEELLGMTFLAITHPRDREANADLIARALAGELRTYAMEKRYTRKDGRIIWAALNASLVRDDRGAPLYFISQIQDITERKAAEAEFAETQQHTRQVLERITDGFYALDRDWRFTFLNDAAEQMLDRARAELIGQNVWQAFAPAIDTPLFAAYQQAMTNGVTTSVEFFYPPLDEWFEVRVYPSADGLSVFFRDVTERRRLAQELRASEAKYRTLINQLPAVVYAVAVDQIQTPLYFSPNIEALTGYRPAELMAREKSWLEYVHPDDRERVAVEDARAIASGERLRIEYRYRRKDGSYIWILDDSGPVIGETGTVGAIQGVLLDISERVQAEEERARLAAIVEGAEDAIVSRTLAGTVTSWNRGAERLYGYRADEMIGQTFEVLLPSGDTSIELVRAAEFGIRPTHFETTRLRRDGAPVDVAIALSPIRDRDGRMIGVSSITRDITERKRVETELRAALVASQSAMRSKTLFLAMMSHELRTPLQAVVG